MKLISTITICIIMFLAGGCSNKKKFIEAEFEATVEKAEKTRNPDLILSYLAKTSEMPEISKANAYVQLGISFVDNKNDKEAIKYFNKSLSYAGKETDNMSILIRCTALYESAKIYTREKDYSKSMYFYEKFLLEYKKNPSLEVNLVDIYLDLSFCAMFAKKYSYQKKMLFKALNLQTSINKNSMIMVRIYSFLTNCYIQLNEYSLAEKSGLKAVALCKHNNKEDSLYAGILYFLLGRIYYHQNKRSDAIKYMKKAHFVLSKTRGNTHNNTKEAARLIKEWQH